MWWKKNGWKLPLLVACIAGLSVALFWGMAPVERSDEPGESLAPAPAAVSAVTAIPLETAEPAPSETPEGPSPSGIPAPSSSPASEEPDPNGADGGPVCTLSIQCTTVLERMDDLAEEQQALIPQDGVILGPTAVPFEAGESAFDLLQRVCREQAIHMEFSDAPLYHCAYIEGIQNLYELDAGPLSGWMYQVNGQFPNYSCSQYTVEDGDVIRWLYTCDLGGDIGGQDAAGQRGE